MKRALLLVTLATVVMSAAVVSAEDAPPFKRYRVEKLLVKYRVTGMQEGIEELGFDRFGMRERKRTIVETAGQETRTLVLINHDDMYTVDEKLKTGNRIATPMIKELIAQGRTDMTALAAEMMTQMGGKVIGKDKVLGKEAEVWQIEQMGATVWIWNGVSLKTITKLGGVSMTIEAYEINEQPIFKDADFTPGKDVTVTDQGTMENMLQQTKEQP